MNYIGRSLGFGKLTSGPQEGGKGSMENLREREREKKKDFTKYIFRAVKVNVSIR